MRGIRLGQQQKSGGTKSGSYRHYPPKPALIRQSSPFIIPIFLQHLGCPHRCIFCNQAPITGTSSQKDSHPTGKTIADEIETWLGRLSERHRQVQVAFYGGSFTGLPMKQQLQHLLAVQPFIKSGHVNEIRLSTRPDYIVSTSPKFLQDFGVTIIEIGVQSMNQDVLDQSLRGHTVQHVEQAISLLKKYGFTTGVQLMIGLPKESTASTISGATHLAQLQPHFTRIYPTLVIKGSGLEQSYHEGSYRPLSLSRAIALTARLTHIFNENHIPVIRTGLQPNTELEANLIAGPYHPAFGELVKARLFFNKARRQLRGHQHRPCRVIVAQQDRSLLTGHGKKSLLRLTRLGLLDHASIMFENLGGQRGGILVEDII